MSSTVLGIETEVAVLIVPDLDEKSVMVQSIIMYAELIYVYFDLYKSVCSGS